MDNLHHGELVVVDVATDREEQRSVPAVHQLIIPVVHEIGLPRGSRCDNAVNLAFHDLPLLAHEVPIVLRQPRPPHLALAKQELDHPFVVWWSDYRVKTKHSTRPCMFETLGERGEVLF